MAESKVSRIVSAIKSESEKLKDPNVSWNEIRKNIKAKRDAIMKETTAYERVADYLFNEGYAGSFEDALIVADVISEDWYEKIIEATSATRATVRGRVRVPGSAQRATAREDRKAAARERAEARRRQEEADISYAKERRTNPQLLQREAQKRTLSTRMERAAASLGLQ